MDNLQQHYLRLLQGAQKKALSGEFEECLDICFNLRLKPDLALYTRATVGLTICDFIHTRNLPEKGEMAKDALRIAKELKQEENSQKNSFWIDTYDKLIQDAEEAVKRAEEEKDEEQPTTVETGEAHEDDEDLVYIEVPPRKDAPPVVGMPKIEGAFTLHPATMTIAAAAHDSQGGNSSDISMSEASSETASFRSLLPSLPLMPARRQTSVSMLVGRYENLQAPTPPPSSRQGSEQPEQQLRGRR